MTPRAWSTSDSGASALGRRHWPAGSPWARQAALAGIGFGYRSRALEVVRLGQAMVGRPGPVEVPGPEGGDHLGHRPRRPVGGHADDPHPADGQEREGEGVVTAVDLEGLGGLGHHPGGGGRIVGRILHAHDVGHLGGQLDQQLGADPAPGADRDVVEHHREVGGRRHRPEVGGEPGRRGAVVVRGDHQDPFDPAAGHRPGKGHRMGSVVAAGGGDDRDGHRCRPPPGTARGPRRRSAPAPRRWCRPRTRPSDPALTRWSASATAPSRSRAPSLWKGVTMAVTTEPNRPISVSPSSGVSRS